MVGWTSKSYIYIYIYFILFHFLNDKLCYFFVFFVFFLIPYFRNNDLSFFFFFLFWWSHTFLCYFMWCDFMCIRKKGNEILNYAIEIHQKHTQNTKNVEKKKWTKIWVFGIFFFFFVIFFLTSFFFFLQLWLLLLWNYYLGSLF